MRESIAFLDETPLDPHQGISQSDLLRPIRRMHVKEGKFHLKLHVRPEAVVEIEERRLQRKRMGCALQGERDVDLPAMPGRSLWIIGDERRPCPGNRCLQ